MKPLFSLLIITWFTFSSGAQPGLPPLTKFNFIPQTNQLANEIRQTTSIDRRISLSIELANAYIEFGQFYRAIALLQALDSLDTGTKDSNAAGMAGVYLTMAKAYDRLIMEQPMLEQAKKMRHYYKKAYPDKEIYEALYQSYLSRYYNYGMVVKKGYEHSARSLELLHRNPADAHRIPRYFLYMNHAFSIRNYKPLTQDDYGKLADTIALCLSEENITAPFEKHYALVTGQMFYLDRAMHFAEIEPNPDSARHNAMVMEKILLQAIHAIDEVIGPYHPHLARFESLNTLQYQYRQDYHQAIVFANRSINHFTADGLLEEGTFSPFNHILLNAYYNKVKSLEFTYDATRDIGYLKQIDAVLLKIERLFHTYVDDRMLNNQMFGFNQYLKNPYAYFQSNLIRLYTRTQDKRYLARYYHYSELSRHYSLLYHMHRKVSGRKVKNNAPAYERMEAILAARNAGTGPTSDKLRQIKLHQNPPPIINLPSYEEIRAGLKFNQALIQIADLKYNNPNSIEAHIIEKDRDTILRSYLNSHNTGINFNSEDIFLLESIKHDHLDSFKVHSYSLYQQLMQPIVDYLDGRVTELIIQRSQFLENTAIPMELLITTYSPKGHYKQLKYLGQEYAISYRQTRIKDVQPRPWPDPRRLPITVFVAENNQLPPLLYQQEFVDKLRARYDVRVYSGAQSTKAALIKVIEKDALVVVVAHGVGNRSDDSAEKGIYLYDGFLSADEITELNSRTQLLVLAGCSTSIGFRTIEGNINLPRAFALAGVKSMLVSNWDIDERSSLLLIEQWLYYLHQGLSKPEALRLAKADFLRSATARLSAPLYWGAFSIIGDEGAVRIRGRWFMHYIAGGALTLMIGLFLLYRKRTTSS